MSSTIFEDFLTVFELIKEKKYQIIQTIIFLINYFGADFSKYEWDTIIKLYIFVMSSNEILSWYVVKDSIILISALNILLTSDFISKTTFLLSIMI